MAAQKQDSRDIVAVERISNAIKIRFSDGDSIWFESPPIYPPTLGSSEWTQQAAEEVAKAAVALLAYIGSRIHELRTQRHISLEELSYQTAMPWDLLQQIEEGRRCVDSSVLDRILACMGYNTGDLAKPVAPKPPEATPA